MRPGIGFQQANMTPSTPEMHPQVVYQGPDRNLYPDRLTVLVTANRYQRLGQRPRSCVYIPSEAPPMARMRLWRDDQFNRISNCLKFSPSEEAFSGRIPIIDRSISVDLDDCCHSLSPVDRFRASPATAIGVQQADRLSLAGAPIILD